MASHVAVKTIHARDVGREAEDEEDDAASLLKRQRRPFVSAAEEVSTLLRSMDVLPHVMEPFLRKVVQEEVEKTISRYLNSVPRTYCYNRTHASGTRRWRLQFKKKLPVILFAGSRIESEDNSPVQIVVTDSFSNETVTSGHLSSLKLDVFVLDGDFVGDDNGDWTEQEFNNSLVRERDGKRPLLTGDLSVNLTEGTGRFGDIVFTDNSSWIRSRKFKLGVRVHNGARGIGVREAISGAFVVKDHRGELYKKHHPPHLCDEVWRLEKIGKDGVSHRRLAHHGINSVQDFLKFLVIDQESLRNILGSGMSSKNWDIIVQHARECCVDNTPYLYFDIEQHLKLYFNSILQVVGVKIAGGCYQPFSELSIEHQVLVNKLKDIAYRNQKNMVKVTSFHEPTQPLLIEDASHPSASNTLDFPHSFIPIINQDESSEGTFKHFFKPGDGVLRDQYHQLEENTTIQDLATERLLASTDNFSSKRDLFGRQTGDYEAEPSTSDGKGMISNPLMANSTASRKLSYLQYPPDIYLGDGLSHAPGSEINSNHPLPIPGFNSCISSSKWVKLLATLKCGMLIRKRLAAKRRARTTHVSYQMYPTFPDFFYDF